MHFAIFPAHVSKILHLPRKSDARSYEVLHLSHKITLPNLTIWCSKIQLLSGNQRPDLLTSLMNMSLVLRLPHEMHLYGSSWNVPRLPSFLEMLQNPHVLLKFEKVHNPLRLSRETTSERPKVLRTRQFFCTFDFEMCFEPQRYTLFRHLNFQKCAENGLSCAFWFGNVLRATTACTFPSSQLPKVVWDRKFFTLLTSKCGSRHSGVHVFIILTSKSSRRQSVFYIVHFEMWFAPQQRALFHHLNFQKWSETVNFLHCWLRNVVRATTAVHFSIISTSKSGLRPSIFYTVDFEMWFAQQRRAIFHLSSSPQMASCTRRFSEPTFRPSGATNHWKNAVFQDFATFSRKRCLKQFHHRSVTFFISFLDVKKKAILSLRWGGCFTGTLVFDGFGPGSNRSRWK